MTEQERSREERFIQSVISRCEQEKGVAARLRRADNPATEYQSWELLATYGVDLEREQERLPFATIAAALAKAKADRNGSLSLGRAIIACFDGDPESKQAKARLRRVLACHDLPELCRILRPLLTLISSRVDQPLDYVRLLRQLRFFGIASRRGDNQWLQNIKAQWAQEFYGYKPELEEA